MNPFCEIAVEEALRLREAGVASEVVVASIGPTDQQVHTLPLCLHGLCCWLLPPVLYQLVTARDCVYEWWM